MLAIILAIRTYTSFNPIFSYGFPSRSPSGTLQLYVAICICGSSVKDFINIVKQNDNL